MECEFPSISANREEIREIFKNTVTIAVLGLSPKPEKDSHKVAKYLQEAATSKVSLFI